MKHRPPTSTLFPYTTLFRSGRSRPVPRRAGEVRSRERSPARSRAPESVSMRRSEEHTSELQSLRHLVCRLLLEKKNNNHMSPQPTREPHGTSSDTQIRSYLS